MNSIRRGLYETLSLLFKNSSPATRNSIQYCCFFSGISARFVGSKWLAPPWNSARDIWNFAARRLTCTEWISEILESMLSFFFFFLSRVLGECHGWPDIEKLFYIRYTRILELEDENSDKNVINVTHYVSVFNYNCNTSVVIRFEIRVYN